MLWSMMLLASASASAKTYKPWRVQFEFSKNGPVDSLGVHLIYDYADTARNADAKTSLDTIVEVYSADLTTTAHWHEIRRVSDAANVSEIGSFPVLANKRGYFTGSIRLSFIADDTTVSEVGEYAFWWKNDGNGPQIITAREYYTERARTPLRRQPSTKNLEPGDVPGERVIHVGREADTLECGRNAACPRRVQ